MTILSLSLFGQEEPFHKFHPLPYSYNALEPNIDAQTMEIHYDRHHRGYYNNFLKAIKGTELEKMDIVSMFSSVSKQSIAVRNQGGGYWNHTFFWESMVPEGKKIPDGDFKKKFYETFSTLEQFESQFREAAMSIFGSGWAWLIKDENGNLVITTTANQDNPLMDVVVVKGKPLLGIDVWEHAYYLKYKNKRIDYVNNLFPIINWEKVASRY